MASEYHLCCHIHSQIDSDDAQYIHHVIMLHEIYANLFDLIDINRNTEVLCIVRRLYGKPMNVCICLSWDTVFSACAVGIYNVSIIFTMRWLITLTRIDSISSSHLHLSRSLSHALFLSLSIHTYIYIYKYIYIYINLQASSGWSVPVTIHTQRYRMSPKNASTLWLSITHIFVVFLSGANNPK